MSDRSLKEQPRRVSWALRTLYHLIGDDHQSGFGNDPASDAVVIAMAFVAAVVVLHHGLDVARDRGFDGGSQLRAKMKRRALVALRLTLSMIIAFAFSTFFELRLFDAEPRSANATFFQEVRSPYDQKVARIEAEIATLDALNQQQVELKATLIAGSRTVPEIDALLEAVTRLTVAGGHAEGEALRRDGDAINEREGVG